MLHVSHYVPQYYRSKVTVIAKTQLSNITEVVMRSEVSFFFTVVGTEDSMNKLDSLPPTCEPLICSIPQECSQENDEDDGK